MFLSLRAALERWPRQLRFIVVALALLAWVAPTWHVCELGGHVMMSCSGNAPSHHGNMLSAKGKTGRSALICYCAPHDRESKYPLYNGPHLTSAPDSSHATCLALLLQGMPALVSHHTPLIEVFVSRPVVFTSRTFSYSPRQILNTRGRAPPVCL